MGQFLSCKFDSDYQKDRHPIAIKELVFELKPFAYETIRQSKAVERKIGLILCQS